MNHFPQDVVIRAVVLDDAEPLRRRCFTLSSADEMRSQVEAGLRKGASGEGASLVAVVDGEVMGNVTVSRNTHRLERHRAHLGGFVIAPEAQGRGVAREMTRAAALWARDHECTILELECRGGTKAEGAYRGLGFREWGRLPAGLIEEAGTFDQVCFWIDIAEWLDADRAASDG